jgi:hypothetical protein
LPKYPTAKVERNIQKLFSKHKTGLSNDPIFTNIPVDEALRVIRNKLHNNNTLAELAGRSHHGAAGGLPENHIFSGGRQDLPTERWLGQGKLPMAHCEQQIHGTF